MAKASPMTSNRAMRLLAHGRRQSHQRKVEKIAETFAEMLKETFGEADFEEMRRRNVKNKNSGCCASHDFCDANMVMYEAFKKVTGRNEVLGREEDIALWNEAWNFAMKKYLTA